jgi:TetR/AcrR family transcriptional regulator, fatty acid metabolism regulator protein
MLPHHIEPYVLRNSICDPKLQWHDGPVDVRPLPMLAPQQSRKGLTMADKVPTRTASKRLPRDQRMATIMQTARAVLRERGSEQFLTSEVAERCGVSEGTIYKYFATKRDLLIQVAEAWFEEFLVEEQPSNRQRPLRDRLLRVIWHNLSLIRRERNMRIYELNRRIAAQVMDVVEDGVKRGELRSDIPLKLIRDMIFGAIEHQTWAYLRGEGDFSVDDTADGITDIVYRGIARLPPPSAARIDDTLARIERAAELIESGLKSIADNQKA